MKVYNKLNDEEKKYIENSYQIKINRIEFIDMGILNLTFMLMTDKKKYILRIYEADRSLEEEKQEIELLEKISESIPVPRVIKNKKSEYITEYNNKKIALFNYIEGSILTSKDINQAIIREIAWYLGKLHKFSENFNLKNFNRKTRIDLDFYLNEIKKSKIEFEGKEKIFLLAQDLEKINFKSLPSGIIHSDIFLDNIIMKDGHINGIIDFNEAHYGPFVYDLAIVINFWIRDKKFLSFQKENDMIRDFLNNYSRHRRLEKEEIKLLNYACKKMFLTFIALRFYKEKIEKSDKFLLGLKNKNYLSLMKLLD